MMRNFLIAPLLALLAMGGVAQAGLLPGPPPEYAGPASNFLWHGDDPGLVSVSSYDVHDAVLPADESGYSVWTDHHYNGTITRNNEFFEHQAHDFAFSGRTATYRGGTGTLTDGYIGLGWDEETPGNHNTMRFITPEPASGVGNNPTVIPLDPKISFSLSYASAINTIDLYGGELVNEDNLTAGRLTGLIVTLIKPDLTTISEYFTTMPFGYENEVTNTRVNDRIDLTGTSLEGVEAVAFELSDFDGTLDNVFSLSEVRAFDGPPVEVLPWDLEWTNSYEPLPTGAGVPTAPEPGTLAMLGLGSGLGLVVRRFRRRKATA